MEQFEFDHVKVRVRTRELIWQVARSVVVAMEELVVEESRKFAF